MIWSSRLSAAARRQFNALPLDIKREVLSELREMEYSGPPDSGGYPTYVRLRGTRDDWRIKLGAYRIIYRVHRTTHIIRVLRIELRSAETYRGYNPDQQ